MRHIRHALIAGTTVVFLALVACGDIQAKIDQANTKDWEGNWRVDAVTLDGGAQPTYSAVWRLSAGSWSLETAVCAASGSTSSNGNTLTLTVNQSSCPETLPAPVGRAAEGPAEVSGGAMTLTLRHTLNGTQHTLVSQCTKI